MDMHFAPPLRGEEAALLHAHRQQLQHHSQPRHSAREAQLAQLQSALRVCTEAGALGALAPSGAEHVYGGVPFYGLHSGAEGAVLLPYGALQQQKDMGPFHGEVPSQVPQQHRRHYHPFGVQPMPLPPQMHADHHGRLARVMGTRMQGASLQQLQQPEDIVWQMPPHAQMYQPVPLLEHQLAGMHSSFQPVDRHMHAHSSFHPGLESHGSFSLERAQPHGSFQQQQDMRRSHSYPPELQSPGRAAAAHHIMPASPMGAPAARRGPPQAPPGQAAALSFPEPGSYHPAARQQPLMQQQQRDWLSARIARFGAAAGTLEQPLRGVPIGNMPPNFVQVGSLSASLLWPYLVRGTPEAAPAPWCA